MIRKSVQNGINRRAPNDDSAHRARLFRTVSIICEPRHHNLADIPASGGKEMKKCLA